jgi:hypothetical protein
MPTSYRPYEPDQVMLLPAAPQDWLPQGHLAYFISAQVAFSAQLSKASASAEEGGDDDPRGSVAAWNFGMTPARPAQIQHGFVDLWKTKWPATRAVAGAAIRPVTPGFASQGTFRRSLTAEVARTQTQLHLACPWPDACAIRSRRIKQNQALSVVDPHFE